MLEKAMKNIQKCSLLLILVICTGLVSFGQADKITLAIEDGNLKRALKLAEDSEEDPLYKKNPEIYFLKAEVYFKIIRDEFLSSKYPDALKIGIKALKKGKYKADGEYFPEYLPLVDSFSMLSSERAAADYRINKYTGAVKWYNISFELNSDMSAIYWIGKCWLMQQDTTLGEQEYNKVVVWAGEQNIKGMDVDPVTSEAFVYFADKYWRKQQFDSANLYLESARKVFGGNPRIDYFQKEVTKQQIGKLPPSTLMMEKIKYILEFFPTDTLFVKKENALYLYLMRNHYDHGEMAKLDTMLNEFTTQKVTRNGSKLVNQYKKSDQFIEVKPENVMWGLVKYFSKFSYPDISNYVAHRYIVTTAKDSTSEMIQARYQVISDYAAKSHSLKLGNQLLKHAEALYGENASFSNLRSSMVSKNQGKELITSEQGALYDMLMKQTDMSNLPEDIQTLVITYVEALIKDKEYRIAKKVIFAHIKAQPDNPIWESKLDYLAREDFFANYYMTRVREEVVAGMKVGGYTWNGSKATCTPGEINDEVQKKVEDRINYFRRQAGVPDIYLDPEINGWCQKAALMMESNKTLSHTPDSRWSCYSDEGAHAARYSLLTKGATTTLAVTSFFADNNNSSVGNRRWLLYPNGLALGHGSTENACAIWASDDSGSVDSNVYKNQFVAWPPEGNLPKMMVFRYWSFSINQDLKGATVTMTIDGNSVPLYIEDFEEGHRLPTIVWEPDFVFRTIKKDTKVDVTVTLPNGRRYSYTVKVMNFDPIGY
jgi:tetratricopeptide (TPR) repeat protein